jgi:hypothetical protein
MLDSLGVRELMRTVPHQSNAQFTRRERLVEQAAGSRAQSHYRTDSVSLATKVAALIVVSANWTEASQPLKEPLRK